MGLIIEAKMKPGIASAFLKSVEEGVFKETIELDSRTIEEYIMKLMIFKSLDVTMDNDVCWRLLQTLKRFQGYLEEVYKVATHKEQIKE